MKLQSSLVMRSGSVASYLSLLKQILCKAEAFACNLLSCSLTSVSLMMGSLLKNCHLIREDWSVIFPSFPARTLASCEWDQRIMWPLNFWQVLALITNEAERNKYIPRITKSCSAKSKSLHTYILQRADTLQIIVLTAKRACLHFLNR